MLRFELTPDEREVRVVVVADVERLDPDPLALGDGFAENMERLATGPGTGRVMTVRAPAPGA